MLHTCRWVLLLLPLLVLVLVLVLVGDGRQPASGLQRRWVLCLWVLQRRRLRRRLQQSCGRSSRGCRWVVGAASCASCEEAAKRIGLPG